MTSSTSTKENTVQYLKLSWSQYRNMKNICDEIFMRGHKIYIEKMCAKQSLDPASPPDWTPPPPKSGWWPLFKVETSVPFLTLTVVVSKLVVLLIIWTLNPSPLSWVFAKQNLLLSPRPDVKVIGILPPAPDSHSTLITKSPEYEQVEKGVIKQQQQIKKRFTIASVHVSLESNYRLGLWGIRYNLHWINSSCWENPWWTKCFLLQIWSQRAFFG